MKHSRRSKLKTSDLDLAFEIYNTEVELISFVLFQKIIFVVVFLRNCLVLMMKNLSNMKNSI